MKKLIEHTVTFLRIATKKRDGADGFLFVHNFGTGFEELIFQSSKSAKGFEREQNKKEKKFSKPGF